MEHLKYELVVDFDNQTLRTCFDGFLRGGFSAYCGFSYDTISVSIDIEEDLCAEETGLEVCNVLLWDVELKCASGHNFNVCDRDLEKIKNEIIHDLEDQLNEELSDNKHKYDDRY